MSDSKPTRPPRRRLLTRDQVLAALRAERGLHGLTKTAEKYGLAPQQICDCLAGRCRLSKRMAERLSYELIEMYARIGDESR